MVPKGLLSKEQAATELQSTGQLMVCQYAQNHYRLNLLFKFLGHYYKLYSNLAG